MRGFFIFAATRPPMPARTFGSPAGGASRDFTRAGHRTFVPPRTSLASGPKAGLLIRTRADPACPFASRGCAQESASSSCMSSRLPNSLVRHLHSNRCGRNGVVTGAFKALTNRFLFSDCARIDACKFCRDFNGLHFHPRTNKSRAAAPASRCLLIFPEVQGLGRDIRPRHFVTGADGACAIQLRRKFPCTDGRRTKRLRAGRTGVFTPTPNLSRPLPANRSRRLQRGHEPLCLCRKRSRQCDRPKRVGAAGPTMRSSLCGKL